ncbi:hypothetical protein SERLADRAFT_406567 [Serpula lacrymans var. lacrymans S7.9]|uniref:Zona occludens toxin N-terminal domain-containing protein n=1 Tax=Serpula lacrymans var. lacrymans (strain S7.9) TaxID=578457 RepID=F8NMZ3_SERL9|nr:uncharacterized protein SERLADRAFT_406567 [Serpula lacrymans var. lacrymans S7.9]EGO27487.1 hypothetical protein SERLADRAFT_406567 [Serpula lacrymans var. lacrymans S7.9]
MAKKDKKNKDKAATFLPKPHPFAQPKPPPFSSQPPINAGTSPLTLKTSNNANLLPLNDKSSALARQFMSATSTPAPATPGTNHHAPIKPLPSTTSTTSKNFAAANLYTALSKGAGFPAKMPSSIAESTSQSSGPARASSVDSVKELGAPRVNSYPAPLSRGISSSSTSATNALRVSSSMMNGTSKGAVNGQEAYLLSLRKGDPEMHLLQDDPTTVSGRSRDHELKTAPIFTRDAYVAAGYREHTTQYGVMGKTLSIYSKANRYTPADARLYINTNAPFSAVVCGVQGSGKSHTVSILLENMFISNFRQIGSLQRPLAGLVLHFGEGGPGSRPSEAAWVGVSSVEGVHPPPVHVYVSRSSLNTMKTVYAPLGNRVRVEPLLFTEEELDAQAFLSMMAVGSSESAPLYIQVVLSILRDLGENFSYNEFMVRLDDKKQSFNPAQLAGLEQRMALLNSFVDRTQPSERRFVAGQLTIIDLSDPFIDPASACGLFEIITRLFVRAEVGTGKVLVVDEAHKYLSSSKGASGLTNSLLTLTREQRHLAMRVIISTQEPTVVPPVLLDLCTVAILHRFSSPSWWDHLAKHVSADISAEDAFDKVVKLQVGFPNFVPMSHVNSLL